jgi:hypothetical protein
MLSDAQAAEAATPDIVRRLTETWLDAPRDWRAFAVCIAHPGEKFGFAIYGYFYDAAGRPTAAQGPAISALGDNGEMEPIEAWNAKVRELIGHPWKTALIQVLRGSTTPIIRVQVEVDDDGAWSFDRYGRELKTVMRPSGALNAACSRRKPRGRTQDSRLKIQT